jgi:hypothetical protein
MNPASTGLAVLNQSYTLHGFCDPERSCFAWEVCNRNRERVQWLNSYLGGWQELGSFLSTHFDHLFASDIPDKLTPRRPHTQNTSPSSDPKWISSGSLKASLTPVISPESRSSVSTSRSLSHSHHYGLSRSSDARMPDDLTSLLVKSTSRSPPVSLPNQPRSKSLSIPWRV